MKNMIKIQTYNNQIDNRDFCMIYLFKKVYKLIFQYKKVNKWMNKAESLVDRSLYLIIVFIPDNGKTR